MSQIAVLANELHEQAVADFKVSERFAYAFIMKVKRIRDERLYKELGFASFETYCETAWNVKRDYMDERIMLAESFGEDFDGTYRQLGHSKSLLLARLEPEIRKQVEATVDVNDATVKQLKEAQKKVEEAERRAAQAEATATTAQNSAHHFEKLFNSIKNQPPKIETKTVEVLPADYKLLKDTAQEHQRLNVENVQLKRTLDEQRQRYESMLSTENHRKQAVKELKKMCGEMVSSFAQYRKLVMMSFQLTSNDREACQVFEAFSNELESEVRIMFEEIQKGTAIRAV